MEKETWLTLGGTSSGALTNASAKCEPRAAIQAATRLFGFYRASEANDPETFIAGAAAMLAQYPEAVVEKVCDPIRGLPSTNKFLPALAEIREACEREMVWHYAVERRERDRAHTARVLGDPLPKPSADSIARVKAMAAKLGADLAPTRELTPEARLKRLDEIAEDYARTPPAVNTMDFAKYLDNMVEASRPPDSLRDEA